MTGDTTPISDEAVSEFKRAYGVMLAFTDVPDERIRQALALTAPLLVSAEAERLREQRDNADMSANALAAEVEGLRAELANEVELRKSYQREVAALRAAGGQEKP